MDEMYLENLDEFINDENKVVTYKWLSRSLGVHVNQAKQMLYKFVQHQRNGKDNDAISVTYLVAGSVKTSDDSDTSSHKICIVPEERLETTKTKFSSLSSCHVYSVQKSQLKDSNALYSVDYDLLLENILGCNKFSAITCTTSKVRTDKELTEIRKGGSEAYAPSYKPKTSPGTNGSIKSKTNSIGNMFSKAQNQKSKPVEKKTEPAQKAPEKKEVKTKQPEKKPMGGLASAFAKQAAKPKVEKTVEEKPVEKKPAEKPVEEEKPIEKKVVEKAVAKKPPPKKATTKKSKKNADDEDERTAKRRRIKAVESSSEEESDMEEIPPTPPREPTPEPEPEPIEVDEEPVVEEEEEEKEKPNGKSRSGPKPRKQKRRLVPKTFVDDEGFMVTEKVYEVYSSEASEDEIKPAPSKPATKADPKSKQEQKTSKKKPSPNKKAGAKQPSLMNFFKKK